MGQTNACAISAARFSFYGYRSNFGKFKSTILCPLPLCGVASKGSRLLNEEKSNQIPYQMKPL